MRRGSNVQFDVVEIQGIMCVIWEGAWVVVLRC